MGRAFEYRKARKLKRWGSMSRTFTKIGKEITIAVKSAGPDPAGNSRLRALLANAKAANMPKDTVDRAIKKATDKDASDYKEILYEGYGPAKVAIMIETATDNNTRTVANIRSYFTKHGGTLGTSGCLSFVFDHKCMFRVLPKDGFDMDDFQLELIDCGAEDFDQDEDGSIIITGPFESNSAIQNYLEENGYEIENSEFLRVPNPDIPRKKVSDEQREEIDKLLEKLEDDDDVQNVFTNMEDDEDEAEE
ncbi:MAG: YebC/PmpR family DNA-binding transcriptional regulator [Muribaculaceae bacterium]|jgi:YebC/PmpR family DNA-binding regulatory protein|nr:YebC/PmpR family DNA-binding transcriptional regulator [Muribaculaceae bacterium]